MPVWPALLPALCLPQPVYLPLHHTFYLLSSCGSPCACLPSSTHTPAHSWEGCRAHLLLYLPCICSSLHSSGLLYSWIPSQFGSYLVVNPCATFLYAFNTALYVLAHSHLPHTQFIALHSSLATLQLHVCLVVPFGWVLGTFLVLFLYSFYPWLVLAFFCCFLVCACGLSYYGPVVPCPLFCCLFPCLAVLWFLPCLNLLYYLAFGMLLGHSGLCIIPSLVGPFLVGLT